MKNHYYQEIQGWFDFQDVYRSAVEEAKDGDTLVEVGCWRGQSLSYLLVEAANSGKKLDIVGVDTFKGSVGEDYHAQQLAACNIEAECRANCDRADYPYSLLVGDSPRVSEIFGEKDAFFVFIDASHDYYSVKRDIVSWLPKVKDGGVLAGHDYEGAFPGVKHAVRDHFDINELSLSGASWIYRKQIAGGGKWLHEPAGGLRWLLYVPFVNRKDLLEGALGSVRKHEANVVLIDQSENEEGAALHCGPILRWSPRPRFSELMTWVQRDASFRGLDYFLFMHSDAEASPAGVDDLLQEAKLLDDERRKWAAILTDYDALALFNPKAVAEVGCWDGTFAWYVADIDYYNRLQWAGWEMRRLPAACRKHHKSQTLHNLNIAEKAQADRDHAWAVEHYRHKWGCYWPDGVGRLWDIPYNNQRA